MCILPLDCFIFCERSPSCGRITAKLGWQDFDFAGFGSLSPFSCNSASRFFCIAKSIHRLLHDDFMGGDAMKPRERRNTDLQDLLRAQLDQIIDMSHALVRLAPLIDWGARAAV